MSRLTRLFEDFKRDGRNYASQNAVLVQINRVNAMVAEAEIEQQRVENGSDGARYQMIGRNIMDAGYSVVSMFYKFQEIVVRRNNHIHLDPDATPEMKTWAAEQEAKLRQAHEEACDCIRAANKHTRQDRDLPTLKTR